MNWALFGLVVSLVVLVAWWWQVRKRNWVWPGLVTSIGCLMAAALNSAAPVRGIVDPNYVGYVFGLAQAGAGFQVTLVAGSIFIASVVSALLSVSRESGRALWFVAATSAALLVIIGWPTVRGAMTDPAANSIQLGEYLTVPGIVGTIVLLALLVAPFVVGVVWASNAALRGD